MTSLDGRWEEAYDEEEGSCDGERSEEPGDESSDEIDGEIVKARLKGCCDSTMPAHTKRSLFPHGQRIRDDTS